MDAAHCTGDWFRYAVEARERYYTLQRLSIIPTEAMLIAEALAQQGT